MIKGADGRPPHDVTNFEFDLYSIFMGGGNRSTPGKPMLHDQKAAKKLLQIMIAYLTHCHWDTNLQPQC